MQATPRTTPTRYAERVGYDTALAEEIWDSALHCHVGFVVDGRPRVLPMLQVRLGDTLYLHGSTGGRVGLLGRDGLDVCVTATLLDGLSLGRSQPDHSINYRTVIAYGTATVIADPAEKRRVMAALIERIHPGRTAILRAPDAADLAKVAVLAMPLTEWSVKKRAGGPKDEGIDRTLPAWAGVVPLRMTTGVPAPAPGVGAAWPPSLLPPRSPWLLAPTLSGKHVRIEPMAIGHAAGLFTALDDEEVWRHLPVPRPRSVADQEEIVRSALAAYHAGTRVPMVQLDAATGEVVGTTSFYAVDPVSRALAIGFTQVAKPRWRTAFNTEAKLLLMAYAYETLGAVRVEWHTDIRNVRSQEAIERLGATREGLVRKHRLRPDGTWRDTVQYSLTDDEWPAVKARLTERLKTDHSHIVG
jgi:RimJ/RimL family protein N-acetyltransferase/nitroimidazol reductase NimA-like FMN-containing flavoprotein (pyridoxamine 5'-phosphate oxidase superfamily)